MGASIIKILPCWDGALASLEALQTREWTITLHTPQLKALRRGQALHGGRNQHPFFYSR